MKYRVLDLHFFYFCGQKIEKKVGWPILLPELYIPYTKCLHGEFQAHYVLYKFFMLYKMYSFDKTVSEWEITAMRLRRNIGHS